MKGPRTNQLEAPTSFMTSISRRREKIESRIVLAISIVEAISRMTLPSRKIAPMIFATWTTRSVVSPPSLIFETPAGRGVSLLTTSSASSALVGCTS